MDKEEAVEFKPLITVIVNCFNGEKYLEECLNSILNQTYQNWELIFWDNHSQDSSKKIFEKFSDKRFKYFLSPKHTSLYEARDLAIKESSGDFFAFCDADDYWVKEKLDFLIPLFENKNIGIVYSNQWMLNDTNKICKKRKKGILPKGNLSSKIIAEQPVTINTSLIRKSEYLNLEKGFNKKYQIIGDYDFLIRVSKNCLFDCVQKPLIFYRLHENNFTKRHRDLEIEELEDWIKDIGEKQSHIKKKDILLVKELIMYKKITNLILRRKKLLSLPHILKFPNNLKKIKLLLALLLPQSILEKKKEF